MSETSQAPGERGTLRLLGLLLLIGALLSGTVFLGAQAVNTFLPPRTAVVDISSVFEQYTKSSDRQDSLEARIEGVKTKAKSLVEQLQVLEEDLKNTARTAPSFAKKMEHQLRLKLDLDNLRSSEGADLEKQLKLFLQEIKVEITTEIERVAKALDLDLVIEKHFRAETGAPGQGFEWPIVHYHKPEYDITSEVVRRLNERYSRTP